MSKARSHDSFGAGESKARTRASTKSRVLHVRGLPPFVTESDLVQLATPFGVVVRTLLLQGGKQQAFIQMDSVENAASLVSHYTAENPATIRSKTVWIQYSTRDEIKTPATAKQEVKTTDSSTSGEQTPPNSILLVTILNARVQVTLENMYTIFKPYGDVLKIAMFVKNNTLKALVQMGTVDSAMNAKMLLEGKDMFQGCCHLRIGFSNLTSLNIKAGPRARDFTQAGSTSDFTGAFAMQGHNFIPSTGPGQPVAHAHAAAMQAPPTAAMHSSSASNSFGHIASMPSPGGRNGFDHKQMNNMNGMMANQMMGLNAAYGHTEPGCTLLVSNLYSGRVTPDMLFTLFGVYGDVIRVKVLFNKRDTALIQFASAQMAYLAQLHLNHVVLYEKPLKIAVSKHTDIQVPRGETNPEAASLTKDFSNSPIHRFKKAGSKNAKNIHAPSQVLHVSNIHDSATETELRELFGQEQKGTPVVQFFSTNRKMCFIKMDSTHDAILGLIRLHNHRLGDRYLRVSFSNKDPATVGSSGSTDAEQEDMQ